MSKKGDQEPAGSKTVSAEAIMRDLIARTATQPLALSAGGNPDLQRRIQQSIADVLAGKDPVQNSGQLGLDPAARRALEKSISAIGKSGGIPSGLVFGLPIGTATPAMKSGLPTAAHPVATSGTSAALAHPVSLPSVPSPPLRSAADLGKLVREARRRDGLSQQAFADLAGVGRRFLSELEAGKPTLEFDKVLRCAATAGIDLRATARGTL